MNKPKDKEEAVIHSNECDGDNAVINLDDQINTILSKILACLLRKMDTVKNTMLSHSTTHARSALKHIEKFNQFTEKHRKSMYLVMDIMFKLPKLGSSTKEKIHDVIASYPELPTSIDTILLELARFIENIEMTNETIANYATAYQKPVDSSEEITDYSSCQIKLESSFPNLIFGMSGKSCERQPPKHPPIIVDLSDKPSELTATQVQKGLDEIEAAIGDKSQPYPGDKEWDKEPPPTDKC